MSVNFVMRTGDGAQSSTAKLLVTACVVLILSVGGGLFLYLSVRAKMLALIPKTMSGRYEKLNTNGGVASQAATSSFGGYSDRIIECEDGEEDNSDDDIVYMAQDGTVYRKCRYGLLEEDELEMEYDDEMYSYK